MVVATGIRNVRGNRHGESDERGFRDAVSWDTRPRGQHLEFGGRYRPTFSVKIKVPHYVFICGPAGTSCYLDAAGCVRAILACERADYARPGFGCNQSWIRASLHHKRRIRRSCWHRFQPPDRNRGLCGNYRQSRLSESLGLEPSERRWHWRPVRLHRPGYQRQPDHHQR